MYMATRACNVFIDRELKKKQWQQYVYGNKQTGILGLRAKNNCHVRKIHQEICIQAF